MKIQIFIIKFITPFIWKYFPGRKINSLKNFAAVEKDSGCRFMQYLTIVKDPDIKSELFQHAMEEFHHSSMFDNLAHSLNKKYFNHEVAPRKFLVTEDSSTEELINAYAYAHVGEAAINNLFGAYDSKKIEKSIRATFLKISMDEKRHANTSDEVLLKLCSNDLKLYKKKYFKAKRERLYEEYSILVKKIGELQLGIILRLVYFILGPFVFMTLRARLSFSREKQLAIFKEQVDDLGGQSG